MTPLRRRAAARGGTGTALVAVFVAAAGLATIGCSSAPPAIHGTVDERSQAMALAWAVLSDERKVDGILIVKSADPAIAALLKEIATASGEAADRIETIAAAQGIPLDETGLPAAEMRVRGAIAASTTRELLFSSGPIFERRLLLTQIEALGYASALLAEIALELEAAGFDSDAEAVAADGTRLLALRKRVVDLIAVARRDGDAA